MPVAIKEVLVEGRAPGTSGSRFFGETGEIRVTRPRETGVAGAGGRARARLTALTDGPLLLGWRGEFGFRPFELRGATKLDESQILALAEMVDIEGNVVPNMK